MKLKDFLIDNPITNYFLRNTYFLFRDSYKRRRHDVLIGLIKKHNLKRYMEVGVWTGTTFKKIIKRCPELESIHGCDPYLPYDEKDKTKEEFDDTYSKLMNEIGSHAKLIRETSEDAAKDINQEFYDLIFIDGKHDYKSVKKDIEMWLPKVKDGGFLTGHDYHLSDYSVIKAVNELLGSDNVTIGHDSVWIYKKEKRDVLTRKSE